MNIQADSVAQSKTASRMTGPSQSKKKNDSLIVRVLKNPLFLVVFTWTLMAFLLAFEVSGK